MVLMLTWVGGFCGVGHWELVTFNNVVTLPRQHQVLVELDALHHGYLQTMRVEARRGMKQGVSGKQDTRDRRGDLEID